MPIELRTPLSYLTTMAPHRCSETSAVLTLDAGGATLDGQRLGSDPIRQAQAKLRRLDEAWSMLHPEAQPRPVRVYAAMAGELRVEVALPWLAVLGATRPLAMLALARDVQPPVPPPGLAEISNQLDVAPGARARSALLADEISHRAAACGPLSTRLAAFTAETKTLARFTEIVSEGLVACRCRTIDVDALAYLFLLAWEKRDRRCVRYR